MGNDRSCGRVAFVLGVFLVSQGCGGAVRESMVDHQTELLEQHEETLREIANRIFEDDLINGFRQEYIYSLESMDAVVSVPGRPWIGEAQQFFKKEAILDRSS